MQNQQFTSSILTNFGKDTCITLLTYFMQTGQLKTPLPKDEFGKSQLNIPIINNDLLFKEIEEADKKSKLKIDLDDSDADEIDLSGSDSEPSLDNFENDELVNLLPTFVKKKSIKFINKFFDKIIFL